jgi:general secretion pathway protein L
MWENRNLVNLLPATALGRTSSRFLQGSNFWLFALVIFMGLAAMIMPLAIKREAVVQMLPWVEKGKKAAETVDAVRRELEVRVDQHNYLLEKRQMMPAIIQILEELTRILPDDTWVTTLDIKGKELVIQGETASSVRLIGLFEQSTILKDASFRSPLTKGQSSGGERYQLAVQIRPALAPQQAASVAQTIASSQVIPAIPASGPADPASAATSKPLVSASAALSGVKNP